VKFYNKGSASPFLISSDLVIEGHSDKIAAQIKKQEEYHYLEKHAHI